MSHDFFLEKAQNLDKKDPIAPFKQQFFHANEPTIYLDGNSLGRLPLKTASVMQEVIQQQWGSRLIRSWNEHWVDLPNKISSKIAKIIGAAPDEVFVGDSTSVNLYKLAFAALNFDPSRKKIVTDSLNFPTDIYILQGLIDQQFKSHSLEIIESADEMTIKKSQIAKALDDNAALLTLSLVAFKSAFMYNMQQINELACKNNTLVIWDLSHAVGAVPINMKQSNTDMAVGCTYKYLNGGPGAPAFLYVRRDLQAKLLNPIWAWFSHDKPFDFELNYIPKNTIQRFATGTPSVLSLGAIEAGVEVTLEAGMDNLRNKSALQSAFLIELAQYFLIPQGFSIASPMNIKERGSHISLQHSEGYRINRAMIDPKDGSKSIIPDFRPPNNIRLGIAPLYNSYLDLYECVRRMERIVQQKQYEDYSESRVEVT
jgi:kynureninase